MKNIPLLTAGILFCATLQAQPTVMTVHPASANPGTLVTITGTNFNISLGNYIDIGNVVISRKF